MKLPDAIAPYASLLKWALIVGLLVAVYAYGRGDGREAQRKADAAAIEAKNDALRDSALAHGAAAVRFREIGALTSVAVAEGKAQTKLAAELARVAGKDGAELARQIAGLNRQAERERETCSEAEMLICGSALQ